MNFIENIDIKVAIFLATLFGSLITFSLRYFYIRHISKSNLERENKSKLLDWASSAAVEDFKQDRKKLTKEMQESMTSYIAFYHAFFEILEKKGRITDEEFIELNQYADRISDLAKKFRKERNKTIITTKNI